jgi:hypothetical protein
LLAVLLRGTATTCHICWAAAAARTHAAVAHMPQLPVLPLSSEP